MTDDQFQDFFEHYQSSCYFVSLERDDLTSPPADSGEDGWIGSDIRYINLFRALCSATGRSLPPFEVQGIAFDAFVPDRD